MSIVLELAAASGYDGFAAFDGGARTLCVPARITLKCFLEIAILDQPGELHASQPVLKNG